MTIKTNSLSTPNKREYAHYRLSHPLITTKHPGRNFKKTPKDYAKKKTVVRLGSQLKCEERPFQW